MAYNFDTIARTYDRLNRVMTLGLDRCWRKRAVRGLQGSVLDVACGTGDMVIELAKRGCTVTGVDISEEMLSLARQKLSYSSTHTPSPLRGTPPNLGGEPVTNPPGTAPANSSPKLGEVPEGRRSMTRPQFSTPTFHLADAEHLPFPDASFDAVTCAFGVRNFVHLGQGLTEMLRVLKPGGRLVILELATPDSPVIKPFYRLYTRRVIPWLGSRLAGSREAYTYLPASIESFPKGKDFTALLESFGATATPKKLTFGVCRLYSATH